MANCYAALLFVTGTMEIDQFTVDMKLFYRYSWLYSLYSPLFPSKGVIFRISCVSALFAIRKEIRQRSS